MAPSPRPSIDADRPHLPQIVVPEAQGIVDDDDLYGVSPVGVSDGFRPPHLAQEDDRIEPVPAPLTTSLSNTDHSPRPSSAQKPPPTEDFTLRHDGRMGYLSPDVPNAASEAPSLTRTLTTESDGPIIVPEGPYRGPTRPSHTYRMQSHDSRLQRTISNATTSTMAISRERAYDGPNGPTHPYALYPQNTVPEPEPEIVNANIPIGFNSTIGQQYQRRTGPEGEETADLIGPHGHTEQLPPYTRYPEVAYLRKTPPGSPAPDSARRLSIEPSAGGMGLATRNPEFSSHEELPVRQSAEHSRASIGAISSMTTVNSVSPTLPAAEISEKIPESEREDEKKWKRVARRKVCGIVPVWALCMAVTVVVVVAVLLGAILGVVYSQRNDDRKRPYNTFHSTGKFITTVTTTVDATPLQLVPTDLPGLPLGDYELLIGPAMPSNSLCIVDQEHSVAWSCAMPASNMKLTISALGSDAPNTSNLKVQLNPPDETLSMWSYGTQPPNLDGQKVMTLVRDFDDPEYGPAWFFQVPYSKVVVLQEHVFEGLIVKAVDEDGEKFEYPLKKRTGTTRGTQKRDPHDRRRKGVANPGDKPWFCYWRGTLLEGFLYPNTTSDAGDEAIDAALNAAKSDTTTTLQLPMSIHYYEEGEAATVLPRSSVTPSLITNTASSSSPVTTTKMALPQDDITRPQYPRVVKLEERRLPRKQGYQAPYCVQMLIGEDGVSKTEIANDMGEPRMFEVSERFGETVLSRRAWDEDEAVEEAEWERRTRYGRFASSETEEGEDGLAKRDLPIECHCIWMVE